MQTAIFGGSFNPPHNGHVHLIKLIKERTSYERILLIPLYRPSHKEVSYHVSSEHRAGMVEAMAEACCRECIVDRLELDRGGISYTWDTVQDLLEKYDDITGKIGIVIGDDLLDGLYDWHRIDELKKIVRFTVFCRDLTSEEIEQRIKEVAAEGITLEMTPGETVEVSSSMIRSRIACGQPVEGLLPESVLRYIGTHGLYRS